MKHADVVQSGLACGALNSHTHTDQNTSQTKHTALLPYWWVHWSHNQPAQLAGSYVQSCSHAAAQHQGLALSAPTQRGAHQEPSRFVSSGIQADTPHLQVALLKGAATGAAFNPPKHLDHCVQAHRSACVAASPASGRQASSTGSPCPCILCTEAAWHCRHAW
jgi:hypothetical protein